MLRAQSRSLLVALLCGAVLFAAAAVRSAPSGAEVFAGHCAVCHGAKAEGIPGSFPPLAAQIHSFAAMPAGRDYLVMAVSAGLIGTLSVGGGSYQGAMPAQSLLSEAEVAAVLNHLASGSGKSKSGATLFDAAEVSAVRARHAGVTGPAALALRPSLPDQ
jgi:mono/diheme cytochrome c family protein